MVTIRGYQQRKTSDGKPFLVLELEGETQVQKSLVTGKFYASVAKCTIPCTFDEKTARELKGTTLPGSIIKVPCEPYNYRNPSTGEIVTLDFKFVYSENEAQQIEKVSTPDESKEVEVF